MFECMPANDVPEMDVPEMDATMNFDVEQPFTQIQNGENSS